MFDQLRTAFPQIDWSIFSNWRGYHFLGPVGNGLAIMVIPSFEYRWAYQALLKKPYKGAFVTNQGTLVNGPEGGRSPADAVQNFIQGMQLRVDAGQQASIILKAFPQANKEE